MQTLLVATDADWVADEVSAALGDGDTDVLRVRTGAEVLDAVRQHTPDLIVLDLQIGNMGGMATCLQLDLEVGADRLDRAPVLMLLDRPADVFLAGRSRADGWLLKPLDAFRLRRAARALLAGEPFREAAAS